MKNLLLVPILLALLTFTAPAAHAVVVGKVNIQEILLQVSDAEKAKAELQAMAEKKQKELRADEEKIQKMQEDFQKQHLVLSDAKKAERQREIQESIVSIQEKSQRFQQEMQQKEDQLKEPILERITQVVQEVSAKEKVDLTFEVSIAPVIYAKNAKDLTAKVIEEYNKRHK